jgi:hypothetical protein
MRPDSTVKNPGFGVGGPVARLLSNARVDRQVQVGVAREVDCLFSDEPLQGRVGDSDQVVARRKPHQVVACCVGRYRCGQSAPAVRLDSRTAQGSWRAGAADALHWAGRFDNDSALEKRQRRRGTHLAFSRRQASAAGRGHHQSAAGEEYEGPSEPGPGLTTNMGEWIHAAVYMTALAG